MDFLNKYTGSVLVKLQKRLKNQGLRAILAGEKSSPFAKGFIMTAMRNVFKKHFVFLFRLKALSLSRDKPKHILTLRKGVVL